MVLLEVKYGITLKRSMKVYDLDYFLGYAQTLLYVTCKEQRMEVDKKKEKANIQNKTH